jgi:hypothetical protein
MMINRFNKPKPVEEKKPQVKKKSKPEESRHD